MVLRSSDMEEELDMEVDSDDAERRLLDEALAWPGNSQKHFLWRELPTC